MKIENCTSNRSKETVTFQSFDGIGWRQSRNFNGITFCFYRNFMRKYSLAAAVERDSPDRQ
jgi:hypothetical protein